MEGGSTPAGEEGAVSAEESTSEDKLEKEELETPCADIAMSDAELEEARKVHAEAAAAVRSKPTNVSDVKNLGWL